MSKNEDEISINNEKIEDDEESVCDKLKSAGMTNTLMINASFSRSIKEEQQSVISNLINRKEDLKSINSTFTNDLQQTPKKKYGLPHNPGSALKLTQTHSSELEYRKLSSLLVEKDKEVNQIKENYIECKRKLHKQLVNYKTNKDKLDSALKTNAMMKKLICVMMNIK